MSFFENRLQMKFVVVWAALFWCRELLTAMQD